MLRKLSFVCALVAFECAIGAHPMEAQTPSFFREFNTPGMDRAAAVAADASGVYVIGNKPPRAGSPRLSGVRKYDSQGNELWTREFTVAVGSAQLLGAAAYETGVYIIGYLRSALGDVDVRGQILRKYSAAGDELWSRQLELAPATGVAADATGVYVTGWGTLRKYNAAGDEMWTTRSDDRGYGSSLGLALDASGIYVLGISVRSTSQDTTTVYTVRKYDVRGTELWIRDLGAPSNGRDNDPELIAAAAPDGFFIAGGNGGNAFLRKYAPDGSQSWSRPVAASSSLLYLAGVVADPTGVYVAGFTPFAAMLGQCRSGSGGDSFLRKYDLDGAELWTRGFGTYNASWASGVAVDGGGVYAVGTVGNTQVGEATYLQILQTLNPNSGVYVAKFEKSAQSVSGPTPRIFPGCVVNAASYVGGGVAPGEIVSIFGSTIGPPDLARGQLTGLGTLANSLAATRILFDGMPAPLLFVSDRQSSAVVPYAVAGRTSVSIQVEYKGILSDQINLPVLGARPGLFSMDGSGRGQGAILNEDGTLNSPSNPARGGSVITVFATGGGETAPGVGDGRIVTSILPRTTLPVSAYFNIGRSGEEGGIEPRKGEVLYAGGASGSLAGLLQVNVRVPANSGVTGDAVEFALIIGEQWNAFQVTLALR